MNWASVFAPRLAYRLRYGYWCDHRDTKYMPLTDSGQSVTWKGWGSWELHDLGRAKRRFCARCGYSETTLGHPVRDWIKEVWRLWDDTGIILAFGSGLIGIAVVVLAKWLIGWK